MKLGVIIINRNHIKYTIDLITQLSVQSCLDFELTVVDNGSTEPGTRESLDQLSFSFLKKIEYTGQNRPLNHVWNDFALKNNYELCYK